MLTNFTLSKHAVKRGMKWIQINENMIRLHYQHDRRKSIKSGFAINSTVVKSLKINDGRVDIVAANYDDRVGNVARASSW